MDISKTTTIELEAMGFRLVTQINQAQQNLQVIQQELQRRAQEPKEEGKKPKE